MVINHDINWDYFILLTDRQISKKKHLHIVKKNLASKYESNKFGAMII